MMGIPIACALLCKLRFCESHGADAPNNGLSLYVHHQTSVLQAEDICHTQYRAIESARVFEQIIICRARRRHAPVDFGCKSRKVRAYSQEVGVGGSSLA